MAVVVKSMFEGKIGVWWTINDHVICKIDLIVHVRGEMWFLRMSI